MQVTVPAGVSPGQMVQFQTPSGQMVQAQVPAGLQPGQSFQIQLAPQPQVMSDGPAFIASATFAGAKPGYAFKAGAQGMGYYQTANNPSQPFEVTAAAAAAGGKPLDPGLHSVANMAGTWGILSCFIKPPLWVTTSFPDEGWFETQSMGTCVMNWPCCDSHGFLPGQGPPRRYERTPGTNTFQSADQHTAVLMGERQMTVDGKMYYWGEWQSMNS